MGVRVGLTSFQLTHRLNDHVRLAVVVDAEGFADLANGDGGGHKHAVVALCVLAQGFVLGLELFGKVPKVYNAGDDDEPFICAVNGEVTVDALAEIEEELKGEHEFSSGPGDYVYYACHDSGESDEFGNVLFRPFWELTEIAFENLERLVDEAEGLPAPSSDEPCDDCGDPSCIFKHYCLLPF